MTDMNRKDWHDLAVPVVEALERVATAMEGLETRVLRLSAKAEQRPEPPRARVRHHPTVSIVHIDTDD